MVYLKSSFKWNCILYSNSMLTLCWRDERNLILQVQILMAASETTERWTPRSAGIHTFFCSEHQHTFWLEKLKCASVADTDLDSNLKYHYYNTSKYTGTHVILCSVALYLTITVEINTIENGCFIEILRSWNMLLYIYYICSWFIDLMIFNRNWS